MSYRNHTRVFAVTLILTSIFGCTTKRIAEHTSENQSVSSNKPSQEIQMLVEPYSDSLELEMGEVVATAGENLLVERPCGNLNNWVADAVFTNQTKNVRLSEPAMCLLNTGGIRSSISAGEITLGELYKVMPFDNEIVWARMPVEVLPEIGAYLAKTGGEPISNAELNGTDLLVNGLNRSHTHVWIITSDYLFRGGDKMVFFEKATESNFTTKLLRDALIEEAHIQGDLLIDNTQRIH